MEWSIAPFIEAPELQPPLNLRPTSPSAPDLGCPLQTMKIPDAILGIGLIAGTFLSFGPQYYSIWRRKNTEGLNVISIALGVAAAVCVFVNYLYLQWGVKRLCCAEQGFGKCYLFTLDGQQILSGLICGLVWFSMWYWYFKVDESPDVIRPLEELQKRSRLRNFARFGMAGIIIILVLNTGMAGMLNSVIRAPVLASWVAFVFSTAGTVAVIIQWAPQIWTTWKLRAVGSLSLLMLMIQLPGSFLVLYFQAIVNRAHWSTIMPYVVISLEMTILVTLCLIFTLRDWWRMRIANKLAAEHPEYSFSQLQNQIPTKHVVIANPDEYEAEQMMNLEFDGEEMEDFSGRSQPDHFPDANTSAAPNSLQENMNEVQKLLKGLQKQSTAPTQSTALPLDESDVPLDDDDDNDGL